MIPGIANSSYRPKYTTNDPAVKPFATTSSANLDSNAIPGFVLPVNISNVYPQLYEDGNNEHVVIHDSAIYRRNSLNEPWTAVTYPGSWSNLRTIKFIDTGSQKYYIICWGSSMTALNISTLAITSSISESTATNWSTQGSLNFGSSNVPAIVYVPNASSYKVVVFGNKALNGAAYSSNFTSWTMSSVNGGTGNINGVILANIMVSGSMTERLIYCSDSSAIGVAYSDSSFTLNSGWTSLGTTTAMGSNGAYAITESNGTVVVGCVSGVGVYFPAGQNFTGANSVAMNFNHILRITSLAAKGNRVVAGSTFSGSTVNISAQDSTNLGTTWTNNSFTQTQSALKVAPSKHTPFIVMFGTGAIYSSW